MSGGHLSIRNIAKRFQGIVAVDDVSFEVKAGEVTGLIGPNGSGKTTTMNIVTGLYTTDSGQVLLDGTNLNSLPPHKIAELGVARTFQNIRLLPDHTTFSNVLLGTHLSRKSDLASVLLRRSSVARENEAAAAHCETILKELKISHFASTRAGELSYGDRRRVEIARALALRPKLLLLDEPAAGMNQAEKAALAELILRISDQGVTVLLIEHDIDLVAKVSDHIVVLNFGREIAEGTPNEIRSSQAVIEAYLGSGDDA